jgi:hypothetical protein
MVGKQTVIKDAILAFSNTERNFVLEKGQSTVDLEKARLDYGVMKDVMASLAGSDVSGKKRSGS